MTIFGGCDGNTFNMVFAAMMVVVAILITYYIFTFVKDKKLLGEGMCGGVDQGCGCTGNETMIGDNQLTKIMSGR